ncbi:MAG: hypothetical protein WCD61_07445 [Acinetobacter bohemicus]
MDKNLFFYELEGRGYIFQNKKWDEAKHGFEDDMLNMAWEMWSSAKHSVKAQAVPNLHYEILVKSIIAHVDSHLEANSFVVGDSFDRGWKAAMQCVRNNITMVSKRKDLANAKK